MCQAVLTNGEIMLWHWGLDLILAGLQLPYAHSSLIFHGLHPNQKVSSPHTVVAAVCMRLVKDRQHPKSFRDSSGIGGKSLQLHSHGLHLIEEIRLGRSWETSKPLRRVTPRHRPHCTEGEETEARTNFIWLSTHRATGPAQRDARLMPASGPPRERKPNCSKEVSTVRRGVTVRSHLQSVHTCCDWSRKQTTSQDLLSM